MFLVQILDYNEIYINDSSMHKRCDLIVKKGEVLPDQINEFSHSALRIFVVFERFPESCLELIDKLVSSSCVILSPDHELSGEIEARRRHSLHRIVNVSLVS